MRKYSLPVLLCCCCVLLVIFSAGCAELPPGEETFYFGPKPTTETPELTVTETPQYVTPVSPYPTATTQPPLTAIGPPPEKTGTVITYCVIFQDDLTLNYNTVAYDYELQSPPLTIDFKVFPTLVERFTEYYSSYGSKEYVSIKRKMPADNAEFKLTAYDKDTGDIVVEEGYGREFTYTEEQSVVLRSPGNYHIEIYGSLVTINMTMKVPCENVPLLVGGTTQ
jgi:hypothetical protein